MHPVQPSNSVSPADEIKEWGNGHLVSLFEAVRSERGDAVAVVLGAETISYRELGNLSDRLASGLISSGIPEHALVAVYMERSIQMVAAMLAIWKVGGAYLPIDPAYPETRVRETLADADPFAIIADETRLGILAGIRPLRLTVQTLDRPEAIHRFEDRDPEDLAYVIYTSGSTGKPKGVMVTHSSVHSLLVHTYPLFRFGSDDTWTMFHSAAFDFSVWEIWGCLLTGGRLVIVPFTLSRSPEEFYAFLSEQNVTVLNQTPSAFSMLIQAETRLRPRPLSLRFVILGGEALNLRTLTAFFERHGDVQPQIINMYGITETTVHTTFRRVRRGEAAFETESLIGPPLPHLELRLLNEELHMVAEGEVGEICITGRGVAKGYLNRPSLSSERFVTNPFGPGTMYRSGDLGKRRLDGELVYLGRADRQVKVNGFRVELGEVEAVLTGCAGISQVCVTLYRHPELGESLAAYYVTDSAGSSAEAARRYAGLHLPPQMRPAYWIQLDRVPLNQNGKVDREALPAPSTAREHSTVPQEFASETEKLVAAAFRKILQDETVGLQEPFFEAGGNSLLLTCLRVELESRLAKPIPISWLFDCGTIRAFATRVEKEKKTPEDDDRESERLRSQRASFSRMRNRSTAR